MANKIITIVGSTAKWTEARLIRDEGGAITLTMDASVFLGDNTTLGERATSTFVLDEKQAEQVLSVMDLFLEIWKTRNNY